MRMDILAVRSDFRIYRYGKGVGSRPDVAESLFVKLPRLFILQDTHSLWRFIVDVSREWPLQGWLVSIQAVEDMKEVDDAKDCMYSAKNYIPRKVKRRA